MKFEARKIQKNTKFPVNVYSNGVTETFKNALILTYNTNHYGMLTFFHLQS